MQDTTLSRCAPNSPDELGSTGIRRKQTLIALAAAFAVASTMALPMVARANTYTWDGSTNPADWNTAGNWSTSLPGATNTALFNGMDGGAAPTVTLSAAASVLGITFDTSSAEAYTIGSTASANALAIGSGGVTVNASVTQNENLYGAIKLTASSIFTNNSTGMLTLGDPTYGATAPIANNELTLGTNVTLTIAGTGNVTINSAVNLGNSPDAVVVDLTGTGTLYLNSTEAANGYGFLSLTVDSGTVKALKALQLAYKGALVINGGTYDMNGFSNTGTNSLSGTGGILTNSSSTTAMLGLFYRTPANTSYTYGGDITGNVQLFDNRDASSTTGQTLILSGTNNFGGSSGTAININNFTLTITGSTTVSTGVTLTPSTSGYVAVLGGNGTLKQTGATSAINLGRNGYNVIGEIAPSAGLPTAGGNTLHITTLGGLNFGGGDNDGSGHTATSNSVYVCDISSAGVSDSVALTGHLSLDPTYSVLDLDSLAGAFDGSTYTIFTFTGGLTGTFGDVEGLPGTYALEYHANNIQLVSTEPVPEPASLSLLGLAGLGLLLRRRRS